MFESKGKLVIQCDEMWAGILCHEKKQIRYGYDQLLMKKQERMLVSINVSVNCIFLLPVSCDI
jgi:hypothetical protein